MAAQFSAVRLWAAHSGVVIMPPRHALPALSLAGPLPAARPADVPAAEEEPEPGPGADRQPGCGNPNDLDFPIETRIHGGPATYRAGSGPKTWSLDLKNTTDQACQNIHPVIVLTDQERDLATSQVTLELRDAEGRWRTLSLEKSDADETIGLIEGDFPGFAVPAGRTVTVTARLALSAATRPDAMVVSAATVQRRGDDGDWVGESNAYHFTVLEGDGDEAVRQDTDEPAPRDTDGTGRQDSDEATRQDGDTTQGRSDSPEQPSSQAPGRTPSPVPSQDLGQDPGRESDLASSPRPFPSSSGTPSDIGGASETGSGKESTGREPAGREPAGKESAGKDAGAGHSAVPTEGSARPSDRPSSGAGRASEGASHAPVRPELADTGSGSILGRVAAAVALLVAGAALVVRSRRMRRGRP